MLADTPNQCLEQGRARRLRTLPGLQSFAIGQTWCFVDSATGRRWSCVTSDQPLLFSILGAFSNGGDVAACATRCADRAGASAAAALEFVHALEAEGLLVPEGEHSGPDDRAWKTWAADGWEAAARFDWQCQAQPKRDYGGPRSWNADCDMMRGYLALEAQPPRYKDYPEAPRIELPRGDDRSPFGERVFDNAADQRVAAEPLDLASFGRICFLAFGQTGEKTLHVTGEHVTKTSPSGGSRHPTEVYPIVLDVLGLPRGVYHYNVRDHALELLGDADLEETVRDHIVALRERVSFKPACAFVYTSVPERSMFRYRESRSYRVLHFDVGHVMKTVSMIARARGRPHYSGYSLAESRVEALIGIDGLTETAIAHTTLG